MKRLIVILVELVQLRAVVDGVYLINAKYIYDIEIATWNLNICHFLLCVLIYIYKQHNDFGEIWWLFIKVSFADNRAVVGFQLGW